MGLDAGIQIGYKQVYPEGAEVDIPSLLNGISRSTFLKVVSGLLAEQVKGIHKISELLSFWFRKTNNEFAQDAYSRLIPFEKEHKSISIAGVPAALKLYTYAFNNLVDDNTQTEEEIEINIFKAFLVQNELLNQTDDKITETTEKLPFKLRWFSLHFAQSIRYSDLVNYDLFELFISEFIRSVLLFEFLETRQEAENLLNAFYEQYDVKDWKQYIQQLSGISYSILNKTNKGFLDLTIQEGDNFERDVKFLDTLVSVPFDELLDSDFKALRERPLYKLNNGNYRIVFGLFCVERIFKGLYFNLKAINATLPTNSKVKDLRYLYTYHFSEQHALYIIMSKLFPKKYLLITGEEISAKKYEGGPDYYARFKNKAFVVESKDSLINAALKETGDFAKQYEDLKSKFYVDGNSPKAVMQLLNCIIDIFSGRFKLIDKNYSGDFLKIYPIVVIHDRQLDVPGFNNILNYWFNAELEKVKDKIDVNRIKPITVIDATTLILTHELLKSRQILLENVIDDFHKFVEFKNNYRSYNELMQHGHDTTLPFSFFIKQLIANKKLKRYPDKMLKEKAFIGLNND